MESVDVNPAFWHGKRVLLTGHTGFKGSWLSLWLQSMGVELRGLALEPPTTPSLFLEGQVAQGMVSQVGDIRNFSTVHQVVSKFKPEVVIHMAAQPLVRYSYKFPIETYATNVMGTVHLLEAIRQIDTVKAIVNVTTDKCYENKEWVWGYREEDPMGGFDPYSSSKGCSELITSAYRRSYFAETGVALASARAGNVIGGGDWAIDRLVPDILRSIEKSEPVIVRNPHAIRPWQHVLEPLAGYLALAQKLYEEGQDYANGWNFGPVDGDAKEVSWIVEELCRTWGDGARWQFDDDKHMHEAKYLKLDISKACQKLGWRPKWTLNEALNKIVKWHKAWLQGDDVRTLCLNQIHEYTSKRDDYENPR